MLTRVRLLRPACISASCKDRYESRICTYLPTMAMSTWPSGFALAGDDLAPLGAGRSGGTSRRSLSHDDVIERLLVQQHRDLVDVVGVDGGDDGALLDVGEQRDLAALLLRERCLQRHSSTSGWMPMPRSSFTECCVGLVLISPEPPTIGTSVRCM